MQNRYTYTIALIAAAGVTQAGTVLETYKLFDHPGGAVNPQAYGLRLDGVGSGVDDPLTFSFGSDYDSSTMTLQIVDNGGSFTLNMFGTVTGNSATGGTNFGTFDLNVSYTVFGVANGWEDNNAEDGNMVGTIQGDFGNGDSDEIVNLFGKGDGTNDSVHDSFRFLSDGWRISGDNSTWVGRGWVLPNNTMGDTNDFLFQGAIVPLPPAAWGGLAMLGGLAAARRLRK